MTAFCFYSFFCFSLHNWIRFRKTKNVPIILTPASIHMYKDMRKQNYQKFLCLVVLSLSQAENCTAQTNTCLLNRI